MSTSNVKRPKHETVVSLSCPLSLLPYELALRCLARVSRWDLTTLSLVSKRYHSLVASPEFHETRSLLGCTEEQLYVCIKTNINSTLLWFVLGRERRFMRPIRSLPSQPLCGSSVVSTDRGIYVIGGYIDGKGPISDVYLLDCETHTWRQVPSMGTARTSAVAGVVDGKIYVFGRDSGEVFDPKTQTWNNLAPMTDNVVVMDENIHAMISSVGSFYYFSPSEGKWGRAKNNDSDTRIRSYCCVHEKLLYGCDHFGNVFWRELYDIKWKKVKGLEALKDNFPRDYYVPFNNRSDPLACYCQLRSFGVNIVVLWFVCNDENVDVWCAEISFDRRQEIGEIWGKIEWSEAVATLPRSSTSGKVEVLYSASVIV